MHCKTGKVINWGSLFESLLLTIHHGQLLMCKHDISSLSLVRVSLLSFHSGRLWDEVLTICFMRFLLGIPLCWLPWKHLGTFSTRISEYTAVIDFCVHILPVSVRGRNFRRTSALSAMSLCQAKQTANWTMKWVFRSYTIVNFGHCTQDPQSLNWTMDSFLYECHTVAPADNCSLQTYLPKCE